MRTEANRARLAEMGIDMYVPRAERATAGVQMAPAANGDARFGTTPNSRGERRVINLIAVVQAESRDANLLGDIERALRFARIEVRRPVATIGTAQSAKRSDATDAIIAFDDASPCAPIAGESDGSPSPGRHRHISVSAPATFRGDARAKRKLWRELRALLSAMNDEGEDAAAARTMTKMASRPVNSGTSH